MFELPFVVVVVLREQAFQQQGKRSSGSDQTSCYAINRVVDEAAFDVRGREILLDARDCELS